MKKTISKYPLSPIEIAEGALLADIAVVFLLLSIYIPIVGAFFQVLIPSVFAVLVLRRGFYVSLIAACVGLFLVSITTGLSSFLPMLLPCGAGIFLGVTMRYRLRHWVILVLGVMGGSLTLYGFTILVTLLAGQSPAFLGRQLRGSYTLLAATVDTVASWVGLGGWWRASLYPPIDRLAQSLLAYWWLSLFAALWLVAWPLVIVNYYVTNRFVRIFGYDVRPFPGGRIERLIDRISIAIVQRGRRLATLARRRARA